MEINLINYEEYFLLYADNELSAAERRQVEGFLNNNADLRVEFESILQTVMQPDSNFKFDKSVLLKNGPAASFITEKNCEEIFILYHDNELEEKERSEVESFVLNYPYTESSFLLLGKARIKPEKIVFPEKKALYKKLSSVVTTRILILRSLAAASLAGLLFWAGMGWFDQEVAYSPLARHTKIPDGQYPVNRQETLSETEQKEAIADPLAGGPVGRSIASAPPEPEKVSKEKLSGKKMESAVAGNKSIPDLSKNDKQIPIKPEATELLSGIAVQNEIGPEKLPITAHIDQDITQSLMTPEDHPRTVVYLNVNQEEEESYILNIPANSLQKTRVGIFLKKIRRIAERNDPIKRFFEGEEGNIVYNR